MKICVKFIIHHHHISKTMLMSIEITTIFKQCSLHFKTQVLPGAIYKD